MICSFPHLDPTFWWWWSWWWWWWWWWYKDCALSPRTSAPSLKRKRICRRVNKAVQRTLHIDEDMMKMMVMNDGVSEMMKRWYDDMIMGSHHICEISCGHYKGLYNVQRGSAPSRDKKKIMDKFFWCILWTLYTMGWKEVDSSPEMQRKNSTNKQWRWEIKIKK